MRWCKETIPSSILIGNKIKVAILLDGDDIGKSKGKEAKEKLLTDCLLLNEYAKKTEAEIEDLLPEKLYLNAVKDAYPDMKTFTFTKEEEKISCISKRVKAAFERAGKTFEKWGPSRIIIDLIQQKNDTLPLETLTTFENIFRDINKILE